MTDEPKLAPCPFCGGEAERTTLEEDGPNFGGDVITCKRCFASSHVEFGFKENLNSHWNTRATDATLRKINHYVTALENELNTGPVPGKISGVAAKAALADLMLIARGKDPAHHEDRLSTFDGKIGDENDG